MSFKMAIILTSDIVDYNRLHFPYSVGLGMFPTLAIYVHPPCFSYSQALAAEEQREKEMEELMTLDERKRPYHSMKADEGRVPTEEEMEAYKLKKRRAEDPMADFLHDR